MIRIIYWVTIIIEVIIRYNITSSRKYKRFRGALIALFAQLLWAIIFITGGQYDLLVLTFIDACIWIRGIKRNWPRKRGRKNANYRITR